MIAPHSLLRRSDVVRYRIVQGEAVMIVLRQPSEAVVLNEVATQLLDLLDGETPLSRWVDRLVEEHEVERQRFERDVVEFLGELCDLGAAEVVGGGDRAEVLRHPPATPNSEGEKQPQPVGTRKPADKKRYDPPRILSREPLEAMAAVCTPAPPGKGSGICALVSS